MTVEDASARFAEAGLPRSVRSIQRYCQRGHLACTTVDTEVAEMYLIDPDSVERRIKELQQIEIISRAPRVSRQDALSRDMARNGVTVRDTSRQDVSAEKIEQYEKRIKELEYEKMQIEIDKRAKEYVINQLTEDRKNLFAQVSEHVRTITDQARIIGQLETRLELGPSRVAYEREPQQAYERPTVEPSPQPVRSPRSPAEERWKNNELQRDEPWAVEYPPRYSAYRPAAPGDNRHAAEPDDGVQLA